MKRSQTSHMAAADTVSTETSLYVAGSHAFNNDVLSNFLETQTGLPCCSIALSELSRLLQRSPDATTLIFLDCAAMGNPKPCKFAALQQGVRNEQLKFICYNVAEAQNIECKALKRGIKGILYSDSPVDLFARAAMAVLDGELWFPRRILENLILDNDAPAIPSTEKKTILTRREKEILKMLASGLRNQDIAARLCISPHTVKTHVYNLYRKIEVANRYQAVQWLQHNP